MGVSITGGEFVSIDLWHRAFIIFIEVTYQFAQEELLVLDLGVVYNFDD
jgi:hypothetical protein